MTGRPHAQDEIGKCHSRRVTAILMTLERRDIKYLYARLDGDTILDAMECNEGADIL